MFFWLAVRISVLPDALIYCQVYCLAVWSIVSENRLKVLNFGTLPFPEAAQNAPSGVCFGATSLPLHHYFLCHWKFKTFPTVWFICLRMLRSCLSIPLSCLIATTNVATCVGMAMMLSKFVSTSWVVLFTQNYFCSGGVLNLSQRVLFCLVCDASAHLPFPAQPSALLFPLLSQTYPAGSFAFKISEMSLQQSRFNLFWVHWNTNVTFPTDMFSTKVQHS